MIWPAAEKFTPDNIAHCQSYVNFMSTLDPLRVKFFEEAGFKLPDCANPKYRHSVKGQPCVEIMRNSQTSKVTLNLLCGLNGVMYANTLNGASNTLEFLNFFHEASQFTQPDGNPILEYGDLSACPAYSGLADFGLEKTLPLYFVDEKHLVGI